MNSRFNLTFVTFSTVLVVLLLLGAVMGRSANPEDAYRHLSVYTEVLSRIKSEYVEEPDIKGVTLGAMNGMLEAVDPFASYLTAEQYAQYTKAQESKVSKANVGLLLSRKFGYVGIVNVIPGSAAFRAGLTTGDILESINGVATRDMPLAYAEMLLEGEPNSTIELSVLRLRKPDPQKITLTRAVNKLPTVTSKIAAPGIGLVQIPTVNAANLKLATSQMEQLAKQGAQKFILDLRNSGFGKAEDGTALANLFMENGAITYLEGQKVKREDFKADPARAVFKTQPLVVITNRGTANAAEIAAGALLDSKRAEVVGERSYGDAAMRKAIPMEDGSAVILSVAKYYSPSGKALQDVGVTPSVVVTEGEPPPQADDDNNPNTPEPEEVKPTEDLPLKKAIEVLTKGKDAATDLTESGQGANRPEAPQGANPNANPARPLTTSPATPTPAPPTQK